jgi:hypothetical protein
MTIALLADAETERLARKLAELSLTAVVHETVVAQAAAAGGVHGPDSPLAHSRRQLSWCIDTISAI